MSFQPCSYHSGIWTQIKNEALKSEGVSAETGNNYLTSYFILQSRQDRAPSEGKFVSEWRLTSKAPKG